MSDNVVMLNADNHEPIIGGRAHILDAEGKFFPNGFSISNRRGEVSIGDERVTETTQIRFSAPKFKSQIFEKKDFAIANEMFKLKIWMLNNNISRSNAIPFER